MTIFDDMIVDQKIRILSILSDLRHTSRRSIHSARVPDAACIHKQLQTDVRIEIF
jgi:hypothetical protein